MPKKNQPTFAGQFPWPGRGLLTRENRRKGESCIPDRMIQTDSIGQDTSLTVHGDSPAISKPVDQDPYSGFWWQEKQWYYNDSIFEATFRPFQQGQKRLAETSILHDHHLHTRGLNPRPVNTQRQDWITIVLLAALILFTWTASRHYKRFRQVMLSFGSRRHMNQLTREGGIYNGWLSAGLFTVYLLCLSVFIYFFTGDFIRFPGYREGLAAFAVIFLALLAGWGVKLVILRFLGTIFKGRHLVSSYFLIVFILNVILGMILLPVNIIMAYAGSPGLLYAGLAIIIMIFIYRLIRGFFTVLSEVSYAGFHIILYFCTVEILPILWVVKLVKPYLA
jgi:hypothetical protein